ncbi:MAG: hypothetical protein CMH31_05495, partial [Micavibrio sp.]|nr:hypothetical protein [Micavibrio sp.]
LKASLFFAAFLYPFYKGLTLWQSNLSGAKRFKYLSFLKASTSIITNALILFLIIGFDIADYLFLIIAYMFIPSLLNIVMSTIDFCRFFKEERVEDKGNMITYGLNTSFFTAVHTIALRLDEFILFYLVAPQVMAVFAIANRIPELLRGVTQTLASILAPRFAKHQKITKEIYKAIKLYSFGFAGFVIALTFTIYPDIMLFLFSDKYSDAIFYSQIIMFSLVIGNMANLNFRFIRSQNDSKSYNNVTLIISIVKILASIALVPFFGIWGAIASLFLYRIAMLVSVEYIIRKKYT